MYRRLSEKLPTGERIPQDAVLRLTDMTVIPFDEANQDYREYLAWAAEGNNAEIISLDDPDVTL